jgi:flavoprotein
MGLKAHVPVYVMPTDFRIGEVLTQLPNGRELRLRTREEDVVNVEKLKKMEGLTVIDGPEKIGAIFEKYFGV